MEAEDVRLRDITSAHIPQLIHIGDETNLSPWSAQNYLDELRTPNAIMVALEVGTKIKGFIVGRIVPGEQGDDAEIYNIAVADADQGFGFGQRLFDEFLSRTEKIDISNIWLEVRASNDKAIKFYAKNGFEPVQTRPDFYRDPREPAILMRLSLKKQRA